MPELITHKRDLSNVYNSNGFFKNKKIIEKKIELTQANLRAAEKFIEVIRYKALIKNLNAILKEIIFSEQVQNLPEELIEKIKDFTM